MLRFLFRLFAFSPFAPNDNLPSPLSQPVEFLVGTSEKYRAGIARLIHFLVAQASRLFPFYPPRHLLMRLHALVIPHCFLGHDWPQTVSPSPPV
jgi:hypothetical protein